MYAKKNNDRRKIELVGIDHNQVMVHYASPLRGPTKKRRQLRVRSALHLLTLNWRRLLVSPANCAV